MVNQNIIGRFKEAGDTVWSNCLDAVNCIMVDADDKDYRINKDDIEEVKKNFKKIEDDEEILFIRDLTFWCSRNQGCVITDRGLHFMLEKNKPENAFSLKWSDITTVKVDKMKFSISLFNNTTHHIDFNLLLKKKDPSEKMLNRIACFLQEIADMEPNISLRTNDETASNPYAMEVIEHKLTPKKKVGEYITDFGKLASGVTAYENRKAAKEKKEKADTIMKETNQEIEQLRKFANDRLEALGRARCEMLQTTVGRFIRIVNSLKNSVKEKTYELSANLSVGEADFKEMEGVEMNASNLLATAASGGSLSSLSGAAATNATLAWLGGGSIAAGGGGVAAGATVLAGIKIAATGFGAIIGAAMIAGQIYSKKHTDAENYLAEVQKWQAKSRAAGEIMKGVIKRSDELLSLTSRLEGRTIPILDELEMIAPEFEPQNPTHAKVFQRAAILVKSMSELSQTPLLDTDGNLNEHTLIVANKTQKILNHSLV